MRALIPEEVKMYRDIISGQFQNFVLLSTELDGVDTGVIASLNGEEGNYVTKPLAILVNKNIFKKLKSPGAKLLAGKTLVLE